MSDENDEDMTIPLINKKSKDKEEKKSNNENPEENENNEEDEEEKERKEKEREKIRLKNIKLKKIIAKNKLTGKIYFVFFIQMLIAFLFIYYAFENKLFNKALQNNLKLFYISIILATIIMVVSGKFKLFSVVPFNYFLFIIFTLCISIIICKIVISFSFKTIAILWTLLIFLILSLSIYVFHIKNEIHLKSTSFFVFIVLLIVSLFIKFIGNVPLIDMIFIILCLIAFNIYLIYDVNSLIEDNQVESNDYFLINILLYFDIIMNFIKLFKFIYDNLKSKEGEENKNLEKMKDDIELMEKGINEVQNFGKKKKEEDEKDDKKKKKGKKSKKEDKSDKKEDKKEKKKKEDKKEDKKEKGKKKEKKGSDKKEKKGKKNNKDSGDEEEDFSLLNPENAGKFAENLLGNLIGNNKK